MHKEELGNKWVVSYMTKRFLLLVPCHFCDLYIFVLAGSYNSYVKVIDVINGWGIPNKTGPYIHLYSKYSSL